MEIPLILFVGCLLFLLAFYSWKALNFAYFRPRKLERFLRKQGFKGNRFKFLYGDTKENKQFESSKKPINLDDDIKPRVGGFVTKTINKYGNYCFIWYGPRPSVIINDPEMAKEILTKSDGFVKIQSNIPFFELLVSGVASMDGEKWIKHRKILNPAFHFEKIKLMIPAFKLSCEEVMNRWEEKLISSGDGSGEIDVWPDVRTITSDSISRTAFGSSYEEGRRIFELQNEQVENILSASSSLYLPGSRFLPTKRNRRIFEVAEEVKSMIKSLIDQRMKAIEAGQAPDNNNDLLNLLLESNIREIEQHGKNKAFGMTMDEIIEECKLFYFAGQHAPSALLLWTMVLLSRHPEWQERAAQEVLDVLGNDETTPDHETLNRLKVLNMIIHEVLRLYPPIPMHARRAKNTVELENKNITLPSGIEVRLPVIFFHHDKEVWGEDASEFNPERFRDGAAKAQKGPVSGLYFPFGYGPRICIAQVFALLEAKLVLAMILRKFSFRLSPSYVHAPTTVFGTMPQYGAPLILERRRYG